MAQAVYPYAKYHMAKGDIDVTTDDLRIILVSSAYTYSAADETTADLSGVLATSSQLQNVSISAAGVLDFDDITLSGLDTGETAAAYVLAVSGSYLIAFKDGAAELPLAGVTGVDVQLTVNGSGFLTL